MPQPQQNSPNSDSRRKFLQNATLATGTVLVQGAATDTARAQNAESKDTSEVTIGIVGAGGRGTGALNDSLSINENVKVVAVADITKEKGQKLRKILGTMHEDKVAIDDASIHAGLDAYQKVLDDPKVDLVFFATPPGFRPRHIADAVKAGKHVFAEKPSCVDPAGYRICVEAHDEAVKKRNRDRDGNAISTASKLHRCCEADPGRSDR